MCCQPSDLPGYGTLPQDCAHQTQELQQAEPSLLLVGHVLPLSCTANTQTLACFLLNLHSGHHCSGVGNALPAE